MSKSKLFVTPRTDRLVAAPHRTTERKTTMASAALTGEKTAPAHSQTLSRGIRMLEILSEETAALSIGEVSDRLGVHRSVAYRILRTLEDHGLVARDSNGGLVLGTGLATLARAVARDLQTAALPELTSLANELGMTAFLVVLDRGDCTTLTSVEPRHSRAAVVQRPGMRHPIDAGAPGLALQAILDDSQWNAISPQRPRRPEVASVREQGFAVSHHEVLPGVTGVAAPLTLRPGQQPAAIAVVYLGDELPAEQVGKSLVEAAQRISEQMD
jgi:DNA-binding IclR family transcriptional regulator